jgi:hypothetical protein
MSLTATTRAKAADEGVSIAGVARCLASPWLGVAMVATAVVSQSFGHANGDNSWLYTVAEKVIDGARPYVDIIESNPPAAFLLYAPAVFAARLAHVSVECAAAAFVFLLAGASIWLSGRILRDAGMFSRRELMFLGNAAIFALVLLPGFCFAQREHNACILILPILATYIARSSGARVGWANAAIAGVSAALAMAIKPHFALAIAIPFLFVVARRRSHVPIFAVEQLVAVAGVLANVAIVLLLFPGYLAIAPASFDAYMPLREPLTWLLGEVWFLTNVALLAGLVVTFGRDCLSPRVAIPALASIGFIGTFFLQGKGWVNHGLPGVELAFLAIAVAIAPIFCAEDAVALDAGWARIRRPVLFLFFPAVLAAPILFGVLLPATGFEEYKGLTAAVLRHAPPHPKIIALSPRLDVGHPLTRRVGGEWVGRPNALWLMIFSQMFIDAKRGDEAYRARLATYVERDARGFREDVAANKPDVVLVVDDPRVEKAVKNPDIAAAMADYGPIESADGVAVWTRRR